MLNVTQTHRQTVLGDRAVSRSHERVSGKEIPVVAVLHPAFGAAYYSSRRPSTHSSVSLEYHCRKGEHLAEKKDFFLHQKETVNDHVDEDSFYRTS